MNTRRSTVLLCTALAGAFLLTGLARADAPPVDQQHVTVDPDQWFEIGGDGPQVLGQTVTSGVAGLLTQVELQVACDESDLVVQIRDSAAATPGSTVLASRTVSGIPDTEDWKKITLSPPPFITDETAFARLRPGDVGVKVGEGETAAMYRVAGPPDVALLLERLLALRA